MKEYNGSCHCGSITFKFSSDEIYEDLYRCNCSLCLKKSIIMKPLKKELFELISGEKKILEYQWNKKIAKHFFCKDCGVYTHHIRRRDPSKISVNFMCIDNLIIPENLNIDIIDGASHD